MRTDDGAKGVSARALRDGGRGLSCRVQRAGGEMRVKSESPELLVIEDRPVLLAALLAGLLLTSLAAALWLTGQGQWALAGAIAAGGLLELAALLVFVRRTLVFFDRPGATVTFRSATLLRQTEDRLPLAHVQGAEVQVSRGTEGDTTQRPALRLLGGERRELTPIYSSGAGADRVVRAINRWLAADASA